MKQVQQKHQESLDYLSRLSQDMTEARNSEIPGRLELYLHNKSIHIYKNQKSFISNFKNLHFQPPMVPTII